MLFWAIAVPTWFIGVVLNSFFLLPYLAVKREWSGEDRNAGKFAAVIWPISFPAVAIFFVVAAAILGLIAFYNLILGKFADARIDALKDKEREARHKRNEERETQHLNNLLANRTAEAAESRTKYDDEYSPFRSNPTIKKSCVCCGANSDDWRFELAKEHILLRKIEAPMNAEAIREAQAENEMASEKETHHVGEATVC